MGIFIPIYRGWGRLELRFCMYFPRNEKVKTRGCEPSQSESQCWDDFSWHKRSCLNTANHTKTLESKMQVFLYSPCPNNFRFPLSWSSLQWIPSKPNFPLCLASRIHNPWKNNPSSLPLQRVFSSLGTLFQGQQLSPPFFHIPGTSQLGWSMESFSYCSAASKSLLWHKTPLLCTSAHQVLPVSVSTLRPILTRPPILCGPGEFCLTIFFSLDCHHPAGLQNPQRPIQGLAFGFLFRHQLSCSLTKHYSGDHTLSLCLISLLSLWIFILTTGTTPPQHLQGSLSFDPSAASSINLSVLWTTSAIPLMMISLFSMTLAPYAW